MTLSKIERALVNVKMSNTANDGMDTISVRDNVNNIILYLCSLKTDNNKHFAFRKRCEVRRASMRTVASNSVITLGNQTPVS